MMNMMYSPFPHAGGQYTHADLVERIKMGQRASVEWKTRWWGWCDANGGTRDPAKHEAWRLMQAVAHCGEPPVAPPPHNHAHQRVDKVAHHHHPHHQAHNKRRPRNPYANNPEHASLVAAIKRGQRFDQDWKQRWWAWCDESGNNTYDPAKHAVEDLRNALIHVGDPPAEGNAPPAEEVEPLAPEHEILVNKVKAFQRSHHVFKV